MNYYYNNRYTKTKYEDRGRLLIAFPDDYVVLDFETTGYDCEYDDAIEVAVLKISNRQPINEFRTFLHADYVPIFIQALTGITTNDVKNAPELPTIADKLLSFIGDNLLVGHNISFDINFFFSKSGKSLTNDFADTMRIARRYLTQLNHHRLEDLVAYYKIPATRFHRSLSDCYTTHYVFEALRNDIANTYGSTDAYIDLLKTTSRPRRSLNFDIKSLVCQVDEIDPANPLYKKNVCFTGALEKMIRKDAMQIVVNFGGTPQNSVTSKTNYLVLGNLDYSKALIKDKDGKSSKQKKAEELILKGKDLEILSEDAFYEMITTE